MGEVFPEWWDDSLIFFLKEGWTCLEQHIEKYMPGIDARQGIEWIIEANSMPRGYIIQPGDYLNIPEGR